MRCRSMLMRPLYSFFTGAPRGPAGAITRRKTTPHMSEGQRRGGVEIGGLHSRPRLEGRRWDGLRRGNQQARMFPHAAHARSRSALRIQRRQTARHTRDAHTGALMLRCPLFSFCMRASSALSAYLRARVAGCRTATPEPPSQAPVHTARRRRALQRTQTKGHRQAWLKREEKKMRTAVVGQSNEMRRRSSRMQLTQSVPTIKVLPLIQRVLGRL
jgi:hypothetical protein